MVNVHDVQDFVARPLATPVIGLLLGLAMMITYTHLTATSPVLPSDEITRRCAETFPNNPTLRPQCELKLKHGLR